MKLLRSSIMVLVIALAMACVMSIAAAVPSKGSNPKLSPANADLAMLSTLFHVDSPLPATITDDATIISAYVFATESPPGIVESSKTLAAQTRLRALLTSTSHARGAAGNEAGATNPVTSPLPIADGDYSLDPLAKQISEATATNRVLV